MRLDIYNERLGAIEIETPCRQVTVGSRFWMKVVYTVGEIPVTAGGAIRFRLPSRYAVEGERIECSRAGLRMHTANALPCVNGKDGKEFGGLWWYYFVVLDEGALRPGDTVAVTYGGLGDTLLFPFTWAQRWAVEAAVDPDGSRAAPNSGFALLPDPPHIDLVPDVPEKLETTIPSTLQIGEPGAVFLRARDRYRNVVTGYDSAFDTRLLSADGVRPVAIDFRPNREGVLVCPDLRIDAAGVHRLEVVDRRFGFRTVSNPVRVTAEAPEVRLFWGDTHCHSNASGDTSLFNEAITPETDYRYARYVSHLDFCAVTDHSQNLRAAPEDWDRVRAAAADACEPGAFVTFSAYESTHQPQRQDGDKNVYFRDDEQPCVSEGDTPGLYAALKKTSPGKAMVIPHLHVPTNWERHDPALERVVEVYSHWGCGFSPESRPRIIPGTERDPKSFVTHALEQGARLGFIAGADHSYGHPGDDFWWMLSSFQGGLAAVYASGRTREALWDGLWARHCYATTRARILLRFAVNGAPMGSEISSPRGAPRRITFDVNGTSAIEAVRIYRNDGLLHDAAGDGQWDMKVELEDAAPERPVDYYYVHVLQADGEQAWASPVWVTRP